MKILIIANYWRPWNTPGTFRWLQMSKYIDFDVLTSRKPRGGMYDETLPGSSTRVFRHGYNLYAVLSGLYLSFRALFYKYDLYIFTSPPEVFIIGAYIFQRLGRRVILDMRDKIDRDNQKLKFMVPVYRFFYKRIKEKVVSFQFLDNGAQVVRSGYDERIARIAYNWEFIRPDRMIYDHYLTGISCGHIPCYCNKPKGYGSSSFINLLHLGFKGLPRFYHREVHDQPIISWEESARQMKEIIKTIKPEG